MPPSSLLRLLFPAIFACLADAAGALDVAPADVASAKETGPPRNVILIIGDGMGDQQITIARNYLEGARGRLLLDHLPLRSAVQVLTVDEQEQPVYVADSANSATAMATGVVTSRGRVAVAADGKTLLPTLLQQAEAAGLRTGLVATSSVTDATPAAFVAHMSLRHCENPAAMLGEKRGLTTLPHCKHLLKANGGPGSISEQIAASAADVVLGGGLKHFSVTDESGNASVLELARDSGFTVITDPARLEEIPLDQRVLGLFAESHLPERWRGEDGREAEAPRPSWANYLHPYLGSVTLPAPMRCEPNPDFVGTPTLAELTHAALRRLHNDAGFFLMVESASIDKAAHHRRACGSIGELQQLLEAVQLALDYADEQGNTLVLVTADHGQAAQIIPRRSFFADYGIPVYTPGRLARLLTPEGSVLAINYATNDFEYQEHTGVNVPLFGNTEALGRIPPMLYQPDIYHIMHDYLFGDRP
ncbi:MAG: alkaline phosphatase [Halieaceae bacterium]|jgi:alkaline phosphatase|nr:alkaline phosphatase [Halieaceae bacterium]